MPYVALAAQLALAGVFLVSGLAKARSISDTEEMVARLRALVWPGGKSLDRAASWVLVLTEITTGAALLFSGSLRTAATLVAVALLCAFTATALWSARARLNLACACFGRSKAVLGWRHVWRNTVLLAIALAGLAGPGAALEVGGVAVAVAAALTVMVLTAFYDDIVDLVRGAW
jgi:uncharacterized membrane protein YphA (DoxX/SURF4 family)